jgi:hypothetical protein
MDYLVNTAKNLMCNHEDRERDHENHPAGGGMHEALRKLWIYLA